MSSLFLDALNCRNRGRPPVWMMRQAGRYMPEYRALRAKHTFLEMCHTPELAAQITLQPISYFQMDAAILFSDILVIPEAMGVGLRFDDGIGPIIEKPVRTNHDVDQLPRHNLTESLSYVSKAISLLTPELKVPLIGFSGAPFTVASYMIEGGSSKDFKKTKQWMMRDPEGFHKLLEIICDHTLAYLKLQAASGVQALQIFDSWAHVLSYPHFKEFSLTYLKRLVDGLKETNIPVILFCRGSSVFAEELSQITPAGISIDWNADITQLRKTIPSSVALQGNLDPDCLYAPPAKLQKEVKRILDGMKGDPGFIFNLGHGIFPDVPVESVKLVVETVKSHG